MEGKAEQTRKAILTTAIEQFGAHGFRATSVARISRDAEVSGSLAYAYFDDKADLFRSALDADAAAVIHEGTGHLLETDHLQDDWPETTLFRLMEAIERHPLTRRVLAGLEPHVTSQMLSLPALHDLRETLTKRLQLGQAEGRVRQEIDPATIARGAVHLWIVLLMGAVQFGLDDLPDELLAVKAIFDAALRPSPTP